MIQQVVKGETPTLLDTAKANELISAINALTNMKVVRGNSDFFTTSNQSSILTLKETGDTTVVGGSSFNADEIQMYVCVNGNISLETFYVKPPST